MNSHEEASLVVVIGRYLKQSREVSQSPWVIDGKRRYPMSVEEAVGEPLRVMFQASTYKFIAAGREDADVRMLGRGRPFAVELRGCRRGPEALQRLIAGHLSVQCSQQQMLQAEQQPQEHAVREPQHAQQQLQEGKNLHYSQQQQQHWQQEHQQIHERIEETELVVASRVPRSTTQCARRADGAVAVGICYCSGEQGCQPVTRGSCKRDSSTAHRRLTPPRAVPAFFDSAARAAAGAFAAPAAAPCPAHASTSASSAAVAATSSVAAPAASEAAPDTFGCTKRQGSDDQQRVCRSSLAINNEKESCNSSSMGSSTSKRSGRRGSSAHGVEPRNTCSGSIVMSSTSGSNVVSRTDDSSSNSSSKGGVCGVCVAVLGEPYTTSCPCMQSGDPAVWKQRVLPVCPCLVYPQQQLSQQHKMKQWQEAEPGRQREGLEQQRHGEIGQQRQQWQQQQRMRATTQQQQQQETGESHVAAAQQRHHPGTEEPQRVQEVGEKDTWGEPLRGKRKPPQHHSSTVESQGLSGAALGRCLANPLSTQSPKEEELGAQAGAACFSQQAPTSGEKGTEKVETAGLSTVPAHTCVLTTSPSLSGCASSRLTAPCSPSNGLARSFLLEREENVSSAPGQPALGAVPAVVVLGMRVVLPPGQQQELEQTLHPEKQKQRQQTQKRQLGETEQHHQEGAEAEGKFQNSLQERQAIDEAPGFAAAAQKVAREAEEQLLASRSGELKIVSDGDKKGGDCLPWSRRKRMRVGKEIRLALQHGAEEKVKRYEALVFAQSPTTPQQLEDLQMKYFFSCGREARTREQYAQEVIARTAANGAVAAAGREDAGTATSGAGVAAAAGGAGTPGGRATREDTAAGGAAGKEMESEDGREQPSMPAEQASRAATTRGGGRGEVAATRGEDDGVAGGEDGAGPAASEGPDQGRGAGAKRKNGRAAADTKGTSAAVVANYSSPSGLEAAAKTGSGLLLFQRTPLRVLHRRSLAERQRMVYRMSFTFLHPHLFVCHLETQAGTYIKEFVHGDYGRTTPSLSSLLHTRCRVLLLDVVDLIVGSVPLHSRNVSLPKSDRRSSRPASDDGSVATRSNSSSVDGASTSMNVSSGCVTTENIRSSSNVEASSSGAETSCGSSRYRSSLAEGNTLLDC